MSVYFFDDVTIRIVISKNVVVTSTKKIIVMTSKLAVVYFSNPSSLVSYKFVFSPYT